MDRILSVVTTCLLQLLCCNFVLGDEVEQAAFFEKNIRPVLVAECYECHSSSSKSVKGGLLIDTRDDIRRGGHSGHGVVPGELAESLVIEAMLHDGLEMPPEKKLDASVIANFKKWIQMGAFDPRDGKSNRVRDEVDLRQAREFWSFKFVEAVGIPSVSQRQWVKNDIDNFILSRLESIDLSPSEDADPRVLVRRIYFDVIGLPPTIEQVNRFLAASAQDVDVAIEELVAGLLDTPQFGERWGRHWLDVVRYAESTGMERNGTFTSAWRYRDYVIDAFNRDLAYDAFIREQIAGDLVDSSSIEDRNRKLIATGMLAIGPKSLNETNKEKFLMDVVDEQIDVVSRAFLGVTASCARCHDHKFDPIPQSEYYALAGIFASTRTLYGTAKSNGNRNPGQLISIDGSDVKTVAVNGGGNGKKEVKKLRKQLENFTRKSAAAQKQLAAANSAKTREQARTRIRDADDGVKRMRSRLRQVEQKDDIAASGAKLVMGVGEAGKPKNTQLRIRGEPSERGDEIPRGFLTIGSESEHPVLKQGGSGRRELADWIARSENPLTARVAVNRVWQHLFGRGIVSTVNNFGANGERPSHPLLLDHLATEFVSSGWSIKQLIRQIMLSRVYRLSAKVDTSAEFTSRVSADPENTLLWRMNQRRLEGEAIRDAMLFVSGELDLQPRKGSPVVELGEGLIGQTVKVDSLKREDRLRSVYLPIVRGAVPEMLSLFDFPEPSIVGGKRNVTTVPTQALFMMNSPTVVDLSQQFAHRLLAGGSEVQERVALGYQLAFSRAPTPLENERAVAFILDAEKTLRRVDKLEHKSSELTALAGFCQSLLASAEFRYIN
ncbi:PSD1 and planctomycete cytochrome C domain-containing protein [bacterium]|nr:PSD1 and planctomycete cytochrome C domain-containing protein [Rubripirellula sp.]MDB4561371.1 PSD1 and planctomycete cytochrome C domain-containing protein [bacterium]MDB4621403.1 PSD1 and planctomycete cytochrome C domain-containing protein [Rubripirellula sp.]